MISTELDCTEPFPEQPEPCMGPEFLTYGLVTILHEVNIPIGIAQLCNYLLGSQEEMVTESSDCQQQSA